MSFYLKNNVLRLTATFADIDGNVTDPSEVTVVHKDPSGNLTTEIYNGGAGNVGKVSTGVYRLDVLLDESGKWTWSAQGDDALGETLVAYSETIFHVRDGVLD